MWRPPPARLDGEGDWQARTRQRTYPPSHPAVCGRGLGREFWCVRCLNGLSRIWEGHTPTSLTTPRITQGRLAAAAVFPSTPRQVAHTSLPRKWDWLRSGRSVPVPFSDEERAAAKVAARCRLHLGRIDGELAVEFHESAGTLVAGLGQRQVHLGHFRGGNPGRRRGRRRQRGHQRALHHHPQVGGNRLEPVAARLAPCSDLASEDRRATGDCRPCRSRSGGTSTAWPGGRSGWRWPGHRSPESGRSSESSELASRYRSPLLACSRRRASTAEYR
jgi:hypothetical protein